MVEKINCVLLNRNLSLYRVLRVVVIARCGGKVSILAVRWGFGIHLISVAPDCTRAMVLDEEF
jgi:hypothetical protein